MVRGKQTIICGLTQGLFPLRRGFVLGLRLFLFLGGLWLVFVDGVDVRIVVSELFLDGVHDALFGSGRQLVDEVEEISFKRIQHGLPDSHIQRFLQFFLLLFTQGIFDDVSVLVHDFDVGFSNGFLLFSLHPFTFFCFRA